MAELDAGHGTLTFAGAGNIIGRLVSGVEDRSLMSQHGTLGLQIRTRQGHLLSLAGAFALRAALRRHHLALELD